MMSKLFYMTLLGLGLSLPALAVDVDAPFVKLTKFSGHVSVNQGDEFAPATKGMSLKPGDRIMVQDDSEATLEFNDECEVEIDENKMATVPPKSTCQGGSLAEQELNPGQGNAIGAGGEGGGWPGNVAGTLIVAGWAGLGLWWLDQQDEDDDDTVSP